jgi:hypothetical protein
MASTLAYASELDLENLLLVTIDSSFSSQIDTWISAAEQMVNNYLGYTTASGLWNEQVVGEINEARVDGDLNLVIHPRKKPVNSLTSLGIQKGAEVSTVSLTNGAGTNRYIIPIQADSIVYSSYELSASSTNLLTKWSDIKYSRYYTKISYIAGYTTIPGPIKLATSYFTADIFMRQANKEGLVALSQGRVAKRWSETRDGKSNFILDAERMLDHYRIASGWF